MEPILKLLVRANLSPDDFEFDENGKQVRLKNNTVHTHLLSPSNEITISSDAGQDDRKKLNILGKLGIFSLDFTPKKSSRIKLFDLPAEAPTPISRIVGQTYTGGLVWIEGGSRQVYANNLQANQRVTLTMIGFFN